jgi:membrane fusion protein, heavy metal efflux system
MSEKEIIEIEEVGENTKVEVPKNNFKAWIITAVIIGLVGLVGLGLIVKKTFSGEQVNAESAEKTDEHGKEEGKEVKLEPEMLNSANLQIEGVTSKTAVSMLTTTGTIEANPQKTQQITSLVSGRLEQINVGIGDKVSAGQTIAVVSSPQVAQMHGKMHEAETQLHLAERNLNRVLKTENRVSVLQSKAKLDETEANLNRTRDLVKLNSSKDLIAAESSFTAAKAKAGEAEATLKRTKKLIELGAGAGKDLKSAQTVFETAKAELDIADNNVKKIHNFVKINSGRDVLSAETAYKNAKAEYDFQSNISLNKEIQEARAAVETSRVDVAHIRDEMRSLGVIINEHTAFDHNKNSSLVYLKAPASGIVSERMFNNGAGVEPNQSIMTLSDVSSVWATANVPQDQMKSIYVGTSAEIKLADGKTINASVSYIEPTLNEDTRTGKVRLAIDNPDSRMKVGMFVEISFRTGKGDGTELAVPSEAVQNIGGKTIVFIPKKDETGAFEVREVKTGETSDGYTQIKEGVELGEMVVTKGSFTLKTQVEKGAVGDEH